MPDTSPPQPSTNPSNQTTPAAPPPGGPAALVEITVASSGTPTFCLVNNPPGVVFNGQTFVVTQQVRFKFFFSNPGYTPTAVSFDQTRPLSQPDAQGHRNMTDRRPDSHPPRPQRMFGVTDEHYDGTNADPWIWKLIVDYTDDQNRPHKIDPEIANTDGALPLNPPPP